MFARSMQCSWNEVSQRFEFNFVKANYEKAFMMYSPVREIYKGSTKCKNYKLLAPLYNTHIDELHSNVI